MPIESQISTNYFALKAAALSVISLCGQPNLLKMFSVKIS